MKKQLLIILLFLTACQQKQVPKVSKHNWKLEGNYKICDTCFTTILVQHMETTGGGDLYIDSGTIYIPKQVLKMIDTTSLNVKSDLMPQSNTVNLYDINLDDEHYFYTLWKDSTVTEFGTVHNFQNVFRLKGKITGFSRKTHNGHTDYYPRLYFKVVKAEEVDTTYFRKFIALKQ